jgi:hypothetical protein
MIALLDLSNHGDLHSYVDFLHPVGIGSIRCLKYIYLVLMTMDSDDW